MSETLDHEVRESDRIVNYFVNCIITGELSAGDRLPSEHRLCEDFSASRTVVREAIQHLKARGMVNTVNGKGSFVAEEGTDHFQDSLQLYSSRTGNQDDWMDLLAMRSLIEAECVKELAEAGSTAKLKAVELALETMKSVQDNLAEFAEADIEFHHQIVRASRNQIFIAVWRALREMSLRFALATYQSVGQVEGKLGEHEAIYQAIKNRQPDEAAEVMKSHLANSRRSLVRILSAS